MTLEQSPIYRPLRDWELKVSDLSTTQKREARALLFGYFGQKKEHFTGKPVIPQHLHDIYDLHHLVERGTPGCNLLINLRLALHGPNANAGKARARARIQTDNKNKENVPVDETTLLRQRIDYSTGSTQMQVNGEAEPEYRRRLWELCDYWKSSISKKRAIYGIAEIIGVSPQATRDYYMKVTSDDGPFEEFKEKGTNEKRVRAKVK